MTEYCYQILEHCMLSDSIDEEKGWDIAYDKIVERYPSLKSFYEEGIDVMRYEKECTYGWCKGLRGSSYLFAFYMDECVPESKDAERFFLDKYPDLTSEQIGYIEENCFA